MYKHRCKHTYKHAVHVTYTFQAFWKICQMVINFRPACSSHRIIQTDRLDSSYSYNKQLANHIPT